MTNEQIRVITDILELHSKFYFGKSKAFIKEALKAFKAENPEFHFKYELVEPPEGHAVCNVCEEIIPLETATYITAIGYMCPKTNKDCKFTP
jgi:hypothetical protein